MLYRPLHSTFMSYCTDCGYDIPQGTRFCPSCGADQLITPPQLVKGSPSVLPPLLGVLGIILGIIIPFAGLVLGAFSAVLAHTDKNKNSNAYTFFCILTIFVSLILWALFNSFVF